MTAAIQANSTIPGPPRHSWLRLQFSLRVLLLAFTAFAVGFPIWYRWPYREEEILSPGPTKERRVTSWQRQWGGGRTKHGPQQLIFGDTIVETTTYLHGRKHGLYELRN